MPRSGHGSPRRFSDLAPCHRLALAFQKQGSMARVLGIGFGADITDTRRRAARDLILQAGTRAAAENTVFPLAYRKRLLQQPQALAHTRGRWIGPEIAPLLLVRPAMKCETRIFVIGYMDIGVTLVVPQQDVVARFRSEERRVG